MIGGTQLIDTFGRVHNNLRISVTDRCNIRCFYCMPETGTTFAPREGLLSVDEIERIARVAVGLGVRKIRLTGGEPLVWKDLSRLIERLLRIEEVEDLAVTTNGVLLAPLARELYDAGLRRINVHLDTLDRDSYRAITRRDVFERVIEGLAVAAQTGFGPIKINAVAVKGQSERDIVSLARFGRESYMDVRFIEFMPLDAQGLWDFNKVLKADEMIEILTREIGPLVPVVSAHRGTPAAHFRFADGIGTVGFISSVTKPFCGDCDRIRLTADGKLRYCLFSVEETDIRPLLRSGHDEDIARAIRDCVRAKWRGHSINSSQFVAPPRPMSAIGG
jgi:GTP 3',8-cyclase